MPSSGAGLSVRDSYLSLGLLLATLILALIAFSTASLAEGPVLEVESPTEDHYTNNDTLVVNGTTEANVTVRVLVEWTGGQEWNNSTSGPDGRFEIWVDLVDGPQHVTVQADDGTGNTTNVTRVVVRDVIPPEISIKPEYLNATRVPWNETMDAYFAVRDEIVLNGTASDDTGRFGVYSINGVVKYIFPGGWWPPWIFERIGLRQGTNTITVGLSDRAGNWAEASVAVFCDSLPPPLTIEAPNDNAKVNRSVITVAGSTDPGMTVRVMTVASAGKKTLNTTAGPDGVFSVEVQLFEGIQTIAITVSDDVGNENTTTLNVISDTRPSLFEIHHPPTDPFLTNMTFIEIVVRMLIEDFADVFINGEQVANKGLIAHRVELDEGGNLIEVMSIDHVWNVFRRTVNVTRDTVPPDLVVTSDNPYYSSNLVVALGGTVVGASMVEAEYKGRSTQAQLVQSPLDLLHWDVDVQLEAFDEEPVIEVWAEDSAGNKAKVTVNVVVDLEGPSLSFLDLPEATNMTPVSIQGSTDADVLTVTVNGVAHDVDEGAFSVDVQLVEGTNTLVISVRDRAGNEVYNTVNITLDTVVPGLSLEYPREVDAETFRLRGTTDDDVVWLWVDEDRYPVENGTFEVKVDLGGHGLHEFRVTVEDAAGNRASETIQVEGGEVPGFGAIVALVAVALSTIVLRRT